MNNSLSRFSPHRQIRCHFLAKNKKQCLKQNVKLFSLPAQSKKPFKYQTRITERSAHNLIQIGYRHLIVQIPTALTHFKKIKILVHRKSSIFFKCFFLKKKKNRVLCQSGIPTRTTMSTRTRHPGQKQVSLLQPGSFCLNLVSKAEQVPLQEPGVSARTRYLKICFVLCFVFLYSALSSGVYQRFALSKYHDL